MFGYSIGRLGCHLSGDGCWGIDNNIPKPKWFVLPNWLWSYNYPHNVVDKGITIVNSLEKHNKVLNIPVFPTSLYESIFGLIMFFIFWTIRKNIAKPYLLFVLFLFSMGIERFFIEFIRINTKYFYLGLYLSQAQFISLFLILFSSILLIYMYFKTKLHQKSLPKGDAPKSYKHK